MLGWSETYASKMAAGGGGTGRGLLSEESQQARSQSQPRVNGVSTCQ